VWILQTIFFHSFWKKYRMKLYYFTYV
jgi:hypothetical protein